MKNFLVLVFSWYAQDIAQILMTQTFLAPEIYAVALIWCALGQNENSGSLRWIAAAVLGGLLMDLRWIGVPGLCAAFYTAVLLVSRWFWHQVPPPNRRTLPFLVIAASACMLMTPFRLFFWDLSVISGRVIIVVAAQWTLTALVLIIFALARPSVHDAESF